jgi:hypothetical protein
LLVDFITFNPSTINTVIDKLQISNSRQLLYEMSGTQPSSQNSSRGPGSGDPGGPRPPTPLPRRVPEIEQKTREDSGKLLNPDLSRKRQGNAVRKSHAEMSRTSTTESLNEAVNMECLPKNRPEDKNRSGSSISGSEPIEIDKNRNAESINGTFERSAGKEPEKKRSFSEAVKGKKKSSNIVIIDFLEHKIENLKETLSIIYSFSAVKPLSLKKLEKGGVSILLRNSSSRDAIEKLLHEKLKGRIKPLSFMETKTLFEVSCVLPKELDPLVVQEKIRAVKFMKRMDKSVVFFMESKDEAKELLANGFYMDPYLLTFEIFVFSPNICCRNCGSRKHNYCESKLCEKCGLSLPHDTSTCTPKCNYCKSEHSFRKCPAYQKEITTAKASKKATYAEALKKNDPVIISDPQRKRRLPPAFSARENPDLVFATVKQAFTNAGLDHLYTHEFAVDVMMSIVSQPVDSESENEEAERIPPKQKKDTAPKKIVKKVTFADDRSSVSESKNKSKSLPSQARYGKAITSIEENMDIEHDSLPDTNEDLKEEDEIFSQSRKKQTSVDRLQVEVRNISKAYCSCGVQFKANPGWKNHLTRTSKCHLDPCVTCGCGRLVLNEKNWNHMYSRMVQHLRSGDCSIAE